MHERRRLMIGAILLVIITSLTTVFAVRLVDSWLGLVSVRDNDAAYFQRIDRVMREIEQRYVKEVEREKLVKGAIAGVVNALDDPYSMYMDETHYREMMVHTQGAFGGIGITVGVKEDKYVTVIAPLKGTPGERAGLKSGDKILKVDGVDIVGLPLDQAVNMMRGEEGTQVTLTVLREGKKEPFDVVITRARIEIPNVEWSLKEPSRVGYIRIYAFNELTVGKLKKALGELKRSGMRALVVDLRHNPGGRLDAAVEVADMLVPRGPIVHVVDRAGNRETYRSYSSGLGLPLAVLVDGGSASASEIVAGAVQDTKAGILVGTRTFGKGTVQSLIELEEGTGLKLTTAQYLTPLDREIDRKGLTPDVIVEPPPAENGGQEADPQLERALELLRAQVETRAAG